MMKKINLFLVFTFLTTVVQAQEKPKLDSAFIVKEYKEFVHSLTEPKQRKFYVYFTSGINISNANPTNNIQNPSSFVEDDKKFQSQGGFQFKSGLFLPFTERAGLEFGISYMKSNYLVKSPLISEGTLEYRLKEHLRFLTVPIRFEYTFFNTRIRPYAKGGVIYSRLLSADISGSRSGSQPLVIVENVKESRNSNLFSLSFGVGAKYILENGYFFVDASYAIGSSEMVKTENRHTNQNLIFGAGYVQDDFKFNSLAINLGYAFSIFMK